LGTGEHYGRIEPAAYYITGRLLVPAVIFGVAQRLNLPPAFSLLNEAAPDENQGAFISINSTILRLG
jgi:hypothetical protein